MLERCTICSAFINMLISKMMDFQTNRKCTLQDKLSPVTMFIKNITIDIIFVSIDYHTIITSKFIMIHMISYLFHNALTHFKKLFICSTDENSPQIEMLIFQMHICYLFLS